MNSAVNHGEWQYLEIMKDLLATGNFREGRNGNTYSKFGAQMRFDLRQGFPLLTTKKLFTTGIITELCWFLRGDTNVGYLNEHGVHIWDTWTDEHGDLGPVYGHAWRSWPQTRLITYDDGEHFQQQDPIDQIAEVIAAIKRDPYGRRHIVTAWNPAELPLIPKAPPPCHCLFQFHVADGRLSCQLYQRSADWFIGVPFNIASYALLTHLVARECGLEVGDFIHTFGDYHLYANHREQALMQLGRSPNQFPVLVINGDKKGIFQIEPEDFEIINYHPDDAIRAEVSA